MDHSQAMQIVSQFNRGNFGLLSWAIWHRNEELAEAELKQLFTTDDVICTYLSTKNLFDHHSQYGAYEAKQHLNVSLVTEGRRCNIHMWIDNQISPRVIHYLSTDIQVFTAGTPTRDDFEGGYIFDIHNRWLNTRDNRDQLAIRSAFGEDAPIVEKCLNIITRHKDRLGDLGRY